MKWGFNEHKYRDFYVHRGGNNVTGALILEEIPKKEKRKLVIQDNSVPGLPYKLHRRMAEMDEWDAGTRWLNRAALAGGVILGLMLWTLCWFFIARGGIRIG